MKKSIRYGVVGFSRNQFDKKAAYNILDDLFLKIKIKHRTRAIEIVSGYTNSGIPKIAYELAEKYGFFTVGFSARQALKVKSGVYPAKKVILRGEKFGEESEAFVNYIDGLIRVGGGPQSRRECELFKARHADNNLESRLKEFEVEWFGEKPDNASGEAIKGLKLIEDFIPQDFQEELIDKIDEGKWLNELKRRVQHFGYKYDYRARMINNSMKVNDLPEWVSPVVDRMLDEQILIVAPDQMIINEYQPGQGITKHVDCVPCFGGQIVSLSLGSPTVMEFQNLVKNEKIIKVLNPGSLLIMEGESRYNWQHGIPSRKSDLINGKRIKRSRRLSLTFRKVILDGPG